jgi:two-component system response regulator YesN
MKALIVDDERYSRDAIRILIDWKKHGIEKVMEAEDVINAMRLIELETPEIIFTDMVMPQRDGIELLSWISIKHPSCKIIVVSGYKDFYYVRNTIKYGGLDYVLKPIDADQIQEVLSQAVNNWTIEANKRDKIMKQEMRRNKIRFLYWDQCFSKLLDQQHMEEAVKGEFLAEFGLKQIPEKAQVIVIDTDWVQRGLVNKLSGNMDLLNFIFHNIVNEYLSSRNAGFAFHYINNKGLTIIIWKTELTSSLLERINQGLDDTFHIRIHFGVGDPIPFPEKLMQSYNSAFAALDSRNLRKTEVYIHQYTSNRQLTSVPFRRHEHHIDLALCSGMPELIQRAVTEWFESVKRMDCVTPRLYKDWWKEFMVFINCWITEHLSSEYHLGWSEPYYVPLDNEGKLSYVLWEEKMISTLLLLSNDIRKKRNKDKHIVYDIAEYLEKNYRDDHDLQHIADLFNLSKEHISRKFKQEIKLTLTDYLSSVRIKHAEILLCNPELKIGMVASMVGYQDEKYFGKVFKKHRGLTPNDFRRSVVQIK